MKRYLYLPLALAAVLTSSNIDAYELATHARLSWNGYLHSQLNLNAAKRGSLGLPKGSYSDLGNFYYDNREDGQSHLRSVKAYDWDRDKSPIIDRTDKNLVPVIPPGWMMRGAVREDDVGRVTAEAGYRLRDIQRPPLDDPYGNFDRVCNHFFDPLNNTPFTGPAAELCGHDLIANAPQWALGTVDSPFTPTAGVWNNICPWPSRDPDAYTLALETSNSGEQREYLDGKVSDTYRGSSDDIHTMRRGFFWKRRENTDAS